MPSYFRPILTTIAAGVVAGYLIHLVAPKAGTLLPARKDAEAVRSEVKPSVSKAVVRNVASAAPRFSEMKALLAEAEKAGFRPRAVLLREPVSVLKDDEARWVSLPAGTAVHVVADDGVFLKIRLNERLFNIPKSATVAGASRNLVRL